MMRGVEPADRSERKRRGAWYTPPAACRAAGRAGGASPAIAEARRTAPGAGSGLRGRAAPRRGSGGARAGGRRRAGGDRGRRGDRRGRPGAPCPEARILVGDGRTLDPWRPVRRRGRQPALPRTAGPGHQPRRPVGPRRWALRGRGGRVPRPLAARSSDRTAAASRSSCRSPSCRRATRDPSGPRSGRAPPSSASGGRRRRCSTPRVTACVLVRAGRPDPGRDPPLARSAVRRRGPTLRPRPSPARAGRRSWPTWPAYPVASARLRRPRGRPRLGHRRLPPAVLRPRAVRQRRRRRTGPRHHRPHRRRAVRVG